MNSMLRGMGDALRQFLAFMEPLEKPAAGPTSVPVPDEVLTREATGRTDVFASGSPITQNETAAAAVAASVVQVILPRAA
jgi:hypothetical protein